MEARNETAGRGWGKIVSTMVLLTALLFASAAPAAAQPVLINEASVASGPGLEAEYIELYTASPNQPLGGYSILSINGNAAGQLGRVMVRIDLPMNAASNAQNLYLLANQRARETYRGLVPDLVFDQSAVAFPNGTQTLLVVKTSSAPSVGTSLTGKEPLEVIDAIGLRAASGADPIYFDAPVVGPDAVTQQAPPAVFRILDGRDKNIPTDFSTGSMQGAGSPENTPGKLNTSGYIYPRADAPGRDTSFGTPSVPNEPAVADGRVTWSRDPNVTYSQSSKVGRRFAIMFSTTDSLDGVAVFQRLNANARFSQLVRDRGINLCYVDVARDSAGRDWAQRCKVFRLPTIVVYEPNGDEVSRVTFKGEPNFEEIVLDFVATLK